MKKQTKYFVEFWYRGFFVGEQEMKEVSSLPSPVKWPDGAYAVAFYTRDDIMDEGQTYQGEMRRVGKLHYHPDSEIETLSQVKKNPKSTATLISNMESNKWKKLVWTRFGDWPQPFESKEMDIYDPYA